MKKIVSKIGFYALPLILVCALVYMCSNGGNVSTTELSDNNFFTAMITDGGGVNDQSFQQSAWEGMKQLSQETGAVTRYVECPQASDFLINMDKLADEKINLIWGTGYKLADIIELAAKTNPELNYAIADYSYGEKTLDNVTGVVFRSQESAFVVGYIAAMTTKSNCIGFIGGIQGLVIDQFEYGYRAGVAYAAKELGKNIAVKVQYAESFSDAAKGKAIAIKMFDECDVLFHAAGGTGVGVIEAAKETGKFVVGADMDQSYLAPNNVITSAIKDVGKAITIVSKLVMNGENIGGRTFSFGLKENCVRITKNSRHLSDITKKYAKEVEDKISDGEIIPPANLQEFEQFIKKI